MGSMLCLGLAVASTGLGQVLGDPLPLAQGVLRAGEMQRNIRSRHIDMVVGSDGAAYFATFFRRTSQSAQHVLIEKRAADGEVVWVRGQESPGRAMSLALTPKGDIVATGFIHGRFGWDDDPGPSSTSTVDDARPFFVRFDSTGQPLVTRYGPAGAIPMLVRVGSDGTVLVVGQTDVDLTWDGQSVECNGDAPLTFVGMFDTAGTCRMLRPLRGRVFVTEATATPDGQFIIGGGFLERLEYDGQTGETEGNFDRDAFVLRVDRDADIVSLATRGSPGNLRPGYRSREGTLDLASSPKGDLVTASLLDWPGHGRDRLVIDRYQPDGTQIGSHMIGGEIASPGSVSVAIDRRGVVLVASTMTDTDRGTGIMSVFRISAAGDFAKVHEQPVSANTSARSIAVHSDVVWLAGHFSGELAWAEQTIRNHGDHQMFVVIQPLK